jgi:hypothetical protein
MLSSLRKGLVYTNISSDIVEHDLDIDADEWCYDGRDVYKGSVDPAYISHGLSVHWLYDDTLKRVGLAEHDAKEPEVFKALWFYDSPFATLYQDPTWKSTGNTLWSKLSNEAYQDYLEGVNIRDEALNSGLLLVTPIMLIEKPTLYTCDSCGKKSLTAENKCSHVLGSEIDFSTFSLLFLDEDYVIHERSPDSITEQPSDASAEERSAQPVDSSVQEESPDALSHLAD